jgi:hypothetical protein
MLIGQNGGFFGSHSLLQASMASLAHSWQLVPGPQRPYQGKGKGVKPLFVAVSFIC